MLLYETEQGRSRTVGQKLALVAALGALGIGAMVGSSDTSAPVNTAHAQDVRRDRESPDWQTSYGPTGIRVRSPIPAPKPPAPPPPAVIVIEQPAPPPIIIREFAPRDTAPFIPGTYVRRRY